MPSEPCKYATRRRPLGVRRLRVSAAAGVPGGGATSKMVLLSSFSYDAYSNDGPTSTDGKKKQ
jgi:hypothetical protein